MKSTPIKWNVHGQRRNFAFGTQRNLYSTDSRWGFALGVTQISVFSDTNMLVFPTRNFALKVLANARTQREWFCVAVESRLNTLYRKCIPPPPYSYVPFSTLHTIHHFSNILLHIALLRGHHPLELPHDVGSHGYLVNSGGQKRPVTP